MTIFSQRCVLEMKTKKFPKLTCYYSGMTTLILNDAITSTPGLPKQEAIKT